MDHEVVGDRLAVVLHVGAEDALADEVDGAHHEKRHHHGNDGADGAVGRRRQLRRVCKYRRASAQRDHQNRVGAGSGPDSQQSISSELSLQSVLWSHFWWIPMHWPLAQENWSARHRTGNRTRTHQYQNWETFPVSIEVFSCFWFWTGFGPVLD